MSTRVQARRTIHRLEADQRRPVRRQQRLSLRQDAADIVLLFRHHAAEAEIARGQLPVDLVTRHMPLLDAHHA